MMIPGLKTERVADGVVAIFTFEFDPIVHMAHDREGNPCAVGVKVEMQLRKEGETDLSEETSSVFIERIRTAMSAEVAVPLEFILPITWDDYVAKGYNDGGQS